MAATTTERVWTFDTNAGPIVRMTGDIATVKERCEASCPLTRKRGYTVTWTRSNGWHVMNVSNSKGTHVHASAVREGWRD